MNDRTIHAVSAEGVELVRYDREGRWYAEHAVPEKGLTRERQKTVGDAVRLALHWEQNGGKIMLGKYGGLRFDSMVKAAREKAARHR